MCIGHIKKIVKTTNVNLMVVLEEKSGDHLSQVGSGDHGYLNQISLQSI